MIETNNTSEFLSEKHKKGIIKLSIIVSVLQISGMSLEFSKFFVYYPLAQKIVQASILSVISISFVFFLLNKEKLYKLNFLIISYLTIIGITVSIPLFHDFYLKVQISSNMFFMRDMLFFFAYIGFVGHVTGKKHIWIQGGIAVVYITFVLFTTQDKFILNVIPLYYVTTIGFCWVMSYSADSLNTYIHELGDVVNVNERLRKISTSKSERLEKYNKTIIELFNRKGIDMESYEENIAMYNHIVETISKTLNISRASIWLFSKDKKSMIKKILIDENSIDNSRLQLFSKDFPRYFQNLLSSDYILINDALVNKETKEFSEVYLKASNIYSILYCPIKLNTETIGIICCEHKNEIREWYQEDLLFIQSISGYISLILKNAQIKSLLSKLEIKNTEVLDSIKYARRLQSAILPPPRLVEKYLAKSFILYKPKDIVAGDFYWMEVMNENILFAVADCTGHGVPGAMISVICYNALNRAVKEFQLLDPAQILNKTRELVIEQFQNSEENIHDGMDISLCVYNQKDKTLKWAGANSPLIICSSNGIVKLAPNKEPIGNHPKFNSFTTVSTNIHEGDLVYLFTDGYIDQFGGEKDKKMMYKRFSKLVESFYSKELSEQKVLFDNAFEEWKGKREQIDDVCLIGVRF